MGNFEVDNSSWKDSPDDHSKMVCFDVLDHRNHSFFVNQQSEIICNSKPFTSSFFLGIEAHNPNTIFNYNVAPRLSNGIKISFFAIL